MKKSLFLLLPLLFSFSNCSSEKYYAPNVSDCQIKVDVLPDGDSVYCFCIDTRITDAESFNVYVRDRFNKRIPDDYPEKVEIMEYINSIESEVIKNKQYDIGAIGCANYRATHPNDTAKLEVWAENNRTARLKLESCANESRSKIRDCIKKIEGK